jgi:NAD-reducing hydrogenase large subunit
MIMSQRIVIDPVTRIEGHAKISIFMDDAGNVSDAEFHVVEFRGFEKFCEGRPYSEMPGITPRICGICPVSHLLASPPRRATPSWPSTSRRPRTSCAG